MAKTTTGPTGLEGLAVQKVEEPTAQVNERVLAEVAKAELAKADPAKQVEVRPDGVALAAKPGVVEHEKTRADGSKFKLRIRTH